MNNSNAMSVPFKIRDNGNDLQDETISGHVEIQDNAVIIHIDGHGVPDTEDGGPVVVELFNREVWVDIFGNINQQEPTHRVPLTDAREIYYQPTGLESLARGV